jgi:hypothetical protein
MGAGSLGRTPEAISSRILAQNSSRAILDDALLNDLIGQREERGRDGQAECLGCLHVDHQLELRRLLDRQSQGLAPLRILST